MEKEIEKGLNLENTEKYNGSSRREFLTGTGGAALAVAATSLLASRGVSQTIAAPAAKQSADKSPAPVKTASSKTASTMHYPHLLSPLKVGNYLLKNRMVATPGTAPHLTVGPEACPNEAIMQGYANAARAGAAIVVLSQTIGVHVPTEQDVFKSRAIRPNQVNPDHGTDEGHFTYWDLANTGCQNIISQLTEQVHFYGSLCLWKHKLLTPAGYDVSSTEAFGKARTANYNEVDPTRSSPETKEITEEVMQKFIDDVVEGCLLSKECGFDGMLVHMGYRGSLLSRFLSPMTNRRTDKYGGSLENRARFNLSFFDAIKKRCGQDYFLLAMMSGEEPKGGFTLDDGAEYAKMFTGHIDMLNLKGDAQGNSPDNFMTGPDKYTPNLYMTEGYKKRGVTLPLNSDGGFTNLDWAEEAIASGKTDTVGACRMIITNRDLIQLAVEGRGEDVRPCIRCNFCHGPNYFTPWNSACVVNPVWGLEHKIERMTAPPKDKKKVAVIGGGPGGMEAALIATQRGHTVTLYEKTAYLGGTFKTIENVSFKWPHKDFKDYLVRQVYKAGVKVHLSTEPDPTAIKKEGYDAVIVAIGAEPIIPDIPGIKGKNVFYAPYVYGKKEETLAKDVVVIGGQERGVETAMYLGEKGHNVTVLEETKILAPDAMRVHFYQALMDSWKTHTNCKAILQARCTGITEDGVTYTDADGKEHSIKAGSVVVAMGMKAKTDLALKFYGTSPWFYTAGDCQQAGDLQTTMRSAFSIASTI